MNRKKGISNIISAILLISITIGLATVFYAWLSGYVSREQQNVREVSAGEVKIEVAILCTSASCNPPIYRLVIRNIGTDNLSVTNNSGNYLISIYVNGNLSTITNITNNTDTSMDMNSPNAVMLEGHVISIDFTPPIPINAGITYQIKIAFPDGTSALVAVEAT